MINSYEQPQKLPASTFASALELIRAGKHTTTEGNRTLLLTRSRDITATLLAEIFANIDHSISDHWSSWPGVKTLCSNLAPHFITAIEHAHCASCYLQNPVIRQSVSSFWPTPPSVLKPFTTCLLWSVSWLHLSTLAIRLRLVFVMPSSLSTASDSTFPVWSSLLLVVAILDSHPVIYWPSWLNRISVASHSSKFPSVSSYSIPQPSS